jgi:hypothetical protein
MVFLGNGRTYFAIMVPLTLYCTDVAIYAQGNSNFRVVPAAGAPPAPGTDTPAYSRGPIEGTMSGYRAGFNRPPATLPVYGPGFYSPYYNPYGSFTSGVADIINAQSNTWKDYEQAGIMKEQKRQAQIDTRRKSFDEWLYERDKTPTPEDERERQRIEDIRRARNDPPANEIWSGIALNQMLVAIQQMHSQGIRGPTVPLNQDILHHINVTSGMTTGSLGLLKDGGKLQWPLPLQDASYETDRKRLDELAPMAYEQAKYGPVKADILNNMIEAVKNINSTISHNIMALTPKQYSQSKSYLRDLDGTINGLQDPNIANYASRKWAATGNTVGELVVQMSQQGLKFAPAVQGDQPAYTALHRGMVEYYSYDPARAWDPVTK